MNPQAKLLRDIRKHIKGVNPGSEPFLSGLKLIEKTAWELLMSRGIDWQVLGGRTSFHYIVNTYVSSPEGITPTYRTPDAKPKPVTQTAYQRGVQKLADKACGQYERHCNWISQRYADALNCDDLNGRTRLRTLAADAAFTSLVKARFATLPQLMAGMTTPHESRMLEFLNRHGEVHVYRDSLFASKREALKAMREDTEALPADHDLIVDYFERAFPPEGFVEDIFDELVRYMRSQDHRDALKFSAEMGAKPELMKRHDQIVLLVATAERKLASLSDPLPPSLHTKLGLKRDFLSTLMGDKVAGRTKDEVRLALRQKMYELCPSKRPKKRKAEAVTAPEPSTLPPSMATCAPGCQCIRHQAAIETEAPAIRATVAAQREEMRREMRPKG